MSWLSAWLKRGIKFSKTLIWPGEKGLPDPCKDPDVSNKTIQKEITDSLKKEEHHA